MEEKLINALAIIAEKAERRGAVLLSEIPEWDEELINYAIDTCGHWSGVIEDGELRLGRLFRKLLEYKHYRYQDGEQVPYHCYAINPDDVLFIEQELEWDADQGMYVGVLAETYRNISWKLRHPDEYAELEAVNKQLEEARAKQAAQQNNSGCFTVVLLLIIATITALI
ncbi:MAG: hypothetical protein KBT39_06810 [Bacteroidales bacterium]|nr:hypothetical protein [Bacteroidales bacterium]